MIIRNILIWTHNLTNIININKIEDILYIKELKDFMIVIVDNKIYYISKKLCN